MKRAFLLCLAWLTVLLSAQAGEVMPSAPEQYFNDYASVVKPGTAEQLNHKLADFERQTSNQILVCVYPTMQTDSSIEDYTIRIARSWKVGGKAHDNGAILFVFVQNHKMRIEVGRGLEGALPDAICKRIISDEISPRFKAGDFAGGLTVGVDSIIAATKGEYKGSGRTAAQEKGGQAELPGWVIVLIAIGIFCFVAYVRRRGTVYSSGGFGSGVGPFVGGFLTGSGGGFGDSGGGGGSSSNDSFSGGGGSFGGGGASGDW